MGTLFEEPKDPILILRAMMSDVKLVEQELRGTVFGKDDYRAGLRIIRGAALRLAERSLTLLDSDRGEDEPSEILAPAARRPPPPHPPRSAKPSVRKDGKPAREPQSDGLQTGILAALKKKPMSSAELIDALGLRPNQVYQACSHMKAQGLIMSAASEADGVRRWKAK